MKRLAKWVLGIAGAVFLLGWCVHGVGELLGGRTESDRILSQVIADHWSGGSVGISGGGVHIGGKNGIHVSEDGVHVGGEHGIHIGGDLLDLDDLDDLEDDDVEWASSGGGTTIRDGQSLAGMDIAAFTDIEVEVDLGDVVVEEGECYGVSLEWDVPTTGKAFELCYEDKNGKLKVWTEEGYGILAHDYLLIATATITIPKGTELKEVEISTDMGDVTWEAEAVARKAELSTDLGDVVCSGLTATELKAESELGDVTVDFPESEGVNYSVLTDLGNASINGASGPTVYETRHGKYYVEVKSDLGNVELNF